MADEPLERNTIVTTSVEFQVVEVWSAEEMEAVDHAVVELFRNGTYIRVPRDSVEVVDA